MKNILKEKNKYLRRALDEACSSEETTLSAWGLKHKIYSSQFSRLATNHIKRERLQVLCEKDNWSNPETSKKIAIGAINDYIEDIGRSISEFDIKTSANPANLELESALKVVESYARNSPDAIMLIANMAKLIIAAKSMTESAPD